MLKTILFIFIFLVTFSAFAQKKFTVSGTIKDDATGEQLIGASVRIKELSQTGTATNNYGFYSLF